MADLFRLSVVTGEGTLFDESVEYVNLPTAFGSLGVMANHAPMLCAVEAGVIRCRWSGGEARVRVSSGVASVENNELTVLVSSGQVLED